MKRVLVLGLALLTISAVAWAGPTVGFSVLGEDFLPFMVGVQYDGQYGVGFGVEVCDSHLFDGSWYGIYTGEAFLTVDVADWAYLSVGFLTSVDVINLAPGVGFDPAYYGTFGVGIGQYGSSLYAKALYDFTGSNALQLQFGIRVDLHGVYKLVQERVQALDAAAE